MKPRERVLTALNNELPDRAPFQATFCPEFAERLAKELGIKMDHLHDPHSCRWNGYELEKAVSQDALQSSIGWVTNYHLKEEPYTDDWGVNWKIENYDTPFGKGSYTAIVDGPLYDPDKISAYQTPNPDEDKLYKNLQRLIDEEQSEYYIIGRLHTTIFETAWALRGMDNLMVDLLIEPERAGAVLDFPFKYHLRVAERMAEMGADMIWLGDDMGAQKSMLMSPDLWRQFFKPRMAEIISSVKRIKSDIKVAYHSDGFNTPIIPDLIEIGLDVLNPIQVESMNPVELKRDFGDKLCFFGGIDVQTTLPFKKSSDVRAEYNARKIDLGKGGGWICAPTHHVQLDTPMENFLALVDSVRNGGQ